MSAPDKISYIRAGMGILLDRLREKDYLLIIAYAEEPTVLPPAMPVMTYWSLTGFLPTGSWSK